MSDTIFFCSHQESRYSNEPWRRVLSQWYQKNFKGNYEDLIYPMDFIDKNYLKLLKKTFNCREQWMMAIKALLFARDDYSNNNLDVFKKIMNTNNPKLMRTLGRQVKGYDDKTCKW